MSFEIIKPSPHLAEGVNYSISRTTRVLDPIKSGLEKDDEALSL